MLVLSAINDTFGNSFINILIGLHFIVNFEKIPLQLQCGCVEQRDCSPGGSVQYSRTPQEPTPRLEWPLGIQAFV